MSVFTFRLGPNNAVNADFDDVHAARDECNAVAHELSADPLNHGYVLLIDDQGQEMHRSYFADYRK